MLPAVAEVVGVPDPVPGLHHVAEPELRLVAGLELLVWAGRAVLAVAYHELVQVRVMPAHGRLDHRMHPVEGVPRRDEHPPPHRRVGNLGEGDPHLQHGLACLGMPRTWRIAYRPRSVSVAVP